MEIDRDMITAAILAGGRATRLGGIDKGWYEWAGKPLIKHALAKVQGRVGQIMISANRSLAGYRQLGYPVYADHETDYQGPLAGIACMLEKAATPYVLIMPVDTPCVPADWVAWLASAEPADIVVARAGRRLHPLHALMRRELAPDARQALREGQRQVRAWQGGHCLSIVDWPADSGFDNINTPEQAQALQNRL